MSLQSVNESTLLGTVPEPGQLVQVRGLQWLVADVNGGSINPTDPNQHLIKLSSIGDDTLGDELEVIWELEPGASVIERAGLPSYLVSTLPAPCKLLLMLCVGVRLPVLIKDTFRHHLEAEFLFKIFN